MRAVTVVGNGPQFVKAAPPSVALQEAGIAEVLVHTGFQPDPGLGGHRIPIDPFYLTWKAREFDFQTRFIEVAGEINQNMPYDCRRRSNHGAQKSSRARTATLHPATPGARARTSLDDVRRTPRDAAASPHRCRRTARWQSGRSRRASGCLYGTVGTSAWRMWAT
jgi:UDP-glucose/GDP-mannose dehydrogenase family, central domain